MYINLCFWIHCWAGLNTFKRENNHISYEFIFSSQGQHLYYFNFFKCLFWHRTTYEKFRINNFTKIYILYLLSTWRRVWQPTPVFLSGEFHGKRSPAGPSPWGCKESDTARWQIHTHPLSSQFFLSFSFHSLASRNIGMCREIAL